MNKTMAIAAVILSVITAFFLVNIMDGTDGAVPAGYVKISDADTVCYTDETLPGTNIYITSSTIRAEAFRDCTTIEKVELTDAVKTIGNSAFEGCTSLTYVSAPGVTSLGNGCFKNTGKTVFEFSAALKTVGSNAFEGCKGFGPYLMGTEVTQLKSETFKDSKVRFEDLRGVTSIADDAFTNCTLKGQIIEEGQTNKIQGVPEITFENVHISGLSVAMTFTKNYILFFITESADAVLKFTDSSGTTTLTSVYNTYGFNCEYAYNNTNLKVEGASWTIHFPADSGIENEIHLAGAGTYTIPYPVLASNLFKAWNIKGESSTRIEITEMEFRNLDSDIYLEATYNPIIITYDHSALPDSSGLSNSGTFAVGDAYPALPDTLGYSFSGWYVGSKFYAGGDKIVTYRDHTAVSAWNADTFEISVISQGSVITKKTVEANSVLTLSELTVTVPESKVLKGWSLLENGEVLTTDPTIDRDCSIYAVYEDRPVHTVRYMDGQTLLASATAYDGSTFTIEQDNPVKEGKNFQNWELGDTGTKYYKGESITVTEDIELKAAWLNIQHTIKYVLDQASTFTYDYGTEVVIGYDKALKDGYELQGWALSSAGKVRYHDGDKITIKEDIMLFPVWKEISEPTTSDPGQTTEDPHDTTTPSTPTTPAETEQDTPSGSTSSDSPTGTSSGTPSSDAPSTDTGTSTTPSKTDTPAVQTLYDLRLMNGNTEFDSYSLEPGTFDLSWTGTPAQTGYKFLGWSKNSSAKTPEFTSNGTILVRSNTTLYAVWEKMIEITYHDDTGTFNDTVYCEKNGTISLKEMDRTGFVFKGWSEKGSGPILKGDIKAYRDLDLYPIWEQIIVEDTTPPVQDTPTPTVQEETPVKIDEPERIVYELKLMNGSTEFCSYSLEPGLFELSKTGTPVQDGSKFLGWSKNASAKSPEYPSQSAISMSSDTTLYAVWEDLIKITYHNDNGTANVTIHCERNETIALKEMMKAGYEFKGWSENDSAELLKGTVKITKDLSLYPIWEQIPAEEPESIPATEGVSSVPDTTAVTTEEPVKTVYELKLMIGNTEFDSYTLEPGTFDLSTTGTPSQAGSKFLGWSKDSSAKYLAYTPKGTISVYKNTTLYAVWEKLMSITYNDDTGTFSDTVYCEKNETVPLKEMKKTGYVFKGWFEKGSSDILKGDMKVYRDLDLYPQWEQIIPEETKPTPVTETVTPTASTVDTTPARTEVPASSSSNGDSNTVMALMGAAIAATITIIVFVLFRRA